MNCRSVQDALSILLVGEGGPEAPAAILEHLAHCAACRSESEHLREVLENLRPARVPDPGEAYWSSFLPRLRDRIARETARRPGSGMSRWAVAAVVTLFLLGGAVSMAWKPSIESNPRMALQWLKTGVPPDAMSDTLEEILPGGDLGDPSAADEDLNWPPPTELQGALDTVCPQDDSDIYTAASDLPPEARELLLQALISDRV
ncbi:MAG TPA: zf-HC2 domain-containing protein [Candidatus Polarisedimenticolia bacterium]|jgi:hypothetical protein|nr:zf-HC2 domain-containing protein [Candidatus Polarisedimenticolia bacterium]